MSALEKDDPKRAFALAFLLIVLMPPDIAAVIAGTHWLHVHHLSLWHGWPLVAITVLLLAIPILFYLLLGDWARKAMPKIRDWLTSHSWLVNIVVIIYFIYQLLK
jgi:hypothetical protein